jgi:hypothetical protein
MKLMKTLLWIALGTAVASAGTITITETITTSGTLDGTGFSNQDVTLTLTGDTGSVVGAYSLIGIGTVTVSGVGSDTFTDTMAAITIQSGPLAGIVDVSLAKDVLDVHNAGFATYALNTSIGPLSGATSGNPGTAFNTAGGSFTISGVLNVDHPATFTATVTPEPGTLAMLGAGMGILALSLQSGGRVGKRCSKLAPAKAR